MQPAALYLHKSSIHLYPARAVRTFTREDDNFFINVRQQIPSSSFILPLSESPESAPLMGGMTERAAYYEQSTTQFSQHALAQERIEKLQALFISLQNCNLSESGEQSKAIGSPHVLTYAPLPCPDNKFVATLHSDQFWYYQLY